jgi:ABC-2 type transport system ATP-binding protein
VAAAGTPAELKARVGGERVEVACDDPAAAEAALGEFADGASTTAAGLLTVLLRPGTRLVEVVRALDAAGVDATDIHRREPTLDDVFLSLTAGVPV